MKLFWKIIRWILFLFFALAAVAFGSHIGEALAFVVVALLCMPLSVMDGLWNYIFHDKKWLKILTAVVVMCVGIALSPTTGTSNSSSKEVATESSRKTVNKSKKTKKKTPSPTPTPTATPIPTCDGTTVTQACELNGVKYNKYIYHPAEPEKSHMEDRSSTEQVQVGTQTQCVDGSYSDAKGRGACSHHGGVANWNAPVYSTQTKTWQEKVVDEPAKDAYYETEVAQ